MHCSYSSVIIINFGCIVNVILQYLNDDLFNTQLMAGDGEIGQQLIANEKVAKV